MSGLNLKREWVEQELEGWVRDHPHEWHNKNYMQDWLAMYDLLKEINDLDYPTDVRLARRFRDKIRALIGGE